MVTIMADRMNVGLLPFHDERLVILTMLSPGFTVRGSDGSSDPSYPAARESYGWRFTDLGEICGTV